MTEDILILIISTKAERTVNYRFPFPSYIALLVERVLIEEQKKPKNKTGPASMVLLCLLHILLVWDF